MRFYFPDSQDLVSPTYDFIHDEYHPLRVRQRDDLYAHEVLNPPPYNGMLVSKAIVDGSVKGAGKYSESQRQRLYRLGVRRFFRLPKNTQTLGDCGAFNYIDEDEPPYAVSDVVRFYADCGFDAGISIDHVIFGYDPTAGLLHADSAWRNRRRITLRYAEEFLDAVDRQGCPFEPVGAAQGWSPASYADSVDSLQAMGYRRIALGGMVPLKTKDIIACLRAVDDVRIPGTELHLLGITRIDAMETFASHGVTSFDSTSAFRQAFMDDRDNYHTSGGTYTAIRIPQADGNPALKRRILAGHVAQREVITTERECLKRLRALDDTAVTTNAQAIEGVLDTIKQYERLTGSKKTYIPEYRRTLTDAPWRTCPCNLCTTHGIEIAIFRGTERNKRRGFHNLSVLATKMSSVPASTR